VAYGIYSELDRSDNDYQVLLSYKPEQLKPHEALLTAENIHTSGPEACDQRYFVYTGNTNWGIQNLEYDSYTGNIFAAVYKGQKPQFPNYPMFVIKGSQAPVVKELVGYGGEKGKVLELVGDGVEFPYGSTGIISLGDGRFYFSEDYYNAEDKAHGSEICLYQYTGEEKELFKK